MQKENTPPVSPLKNDNVEKPYQTTNTSDLSSSLISLRHTKEDLKNVSNISRESGSNANSIKSLDSVFSASFNKKKTDIDHFQG